MLWLGGITGQCRGVGAAGPADYRGLEVLGQIITVGSYLRTRLLVRSVVFLLEI